MKLESGNGLNKEFPCNFRSRLLHTRFGRLALLHGLKENATIFWLHSIRIVLCGELLTNQVDNFSQAFLRFHAANSIVHIFATKLINFIYTYFL